MNSSSDGDQITIGDSWGKGSEAVRAAKQKFTEDGFAILETGPHHGCDFMASKDGVNYNVEVKGRTNLKWPFIQFSEKESEQLENPHFVVALVKIDSKTGKADSVRLLHRKDFTRHQPAAIRWFLQPDVHQALSA